MVPSIQFLILLTVKFVRLAEKMALFVCGEQSLGLMVCGDKNEEVVYLPHVLIQFSINKFSCW